MNEHERKRAIEALAAHHAAGTGVAWSLEAAHPVAVHGECCEFAFINPNGIPGFILDANGIPRPITGPASLARVLAVAESWDTVQSGGYRRNGEE